MNTSSPVIGRARCGISRIFEALELLIASDKTAWMNSVELNGVLGC